MILTKTVRDQIADLVVRARAIEIEKPGEYEAAAQVLKLVRAKTKEVDEEFKPHIKRAHQAHRELIKSHKEQLRPLADAEGTVRGKMLEWDRAQEEKRREEERRLQEAARKKAEEEQLARAVEAEKEHGSEAAEAVLEEPVAAPVVTVQKAVPKVEGISYRTVWKFRVRDLKLVPRKYLVLDERKIGQVVRAEKDQTSIPGIEAFGEKVLASRGGF